MHIRIRDKNLNLNFVSLFGLVYFVEFTCNPCYWFVLIYRALESWAWNYKTQHGHWKWQKLFAFPSRNRIHLYSDATCKWTFQFFYKPEQLSFLASRKYLKQKHDKFNSSEDSAEKNKKLNECSGEHPQKIQQHIHVKSWGGLREEKGYLEYVVCCELWIHIFLQSAPFCESHTSSETRTGVFVAAEPSKSWWWRRWDSRGQARVQALINSRVRRSELAFTTLFFSFLFVFSREKRIALEKL